MSSPFAISKETSLADTNWKAVTDTFVKSVSAQLIDLEKQAYFCTTYSGFTFQAQAAKESEDLMSAKLQAVLAQSTAPASGSSKKHSKKSGKDKTVDWQTQLQDLEKFQTDQITAL